MVWSRTTGLLDSEEGTLAVVSWFAIAQFDLAKTEGHSLPLSGLKPLFNDWTAVRQKRSSWDRRAGMRLRLQFHVQLSVDLLDDFAGFVNQEEWALREVGLIQEFTNDRPFSGVSFPVVTTYNQEFHQVCECCRDSDVVQSAIVSAARVYIYIYICISI